jgi:ATP-dependent Lon protease
MGGDRDTSALKGFRRTYVGAVPGKIVRALKTVEVENPVILIDEVDKLGVRSAQGDPGSVLLEILDPEQNNKFTDDFLDVPIDLSKVLFLCTANMLDTLHPAVLDRMEIIEVAGYTFEEKRHILNKYLLPEALQKSGLIEGAHKFELPESIRNFIIENYCREPGVRSLKKYINRICEKIAFKVVEGSNQETIEVTEANLEDFIGSAKYQSSKFYKKMPPGVVIGLAYSSHGGSILYIESSKNSFPSEQKGLGSLKVTG